MSTLLRFLEVLAVTLAIAVLFAVGSFVQEGPAAAPVRRRPPYVRAVLAVAAVAVVLVLTACGGGDPEDDAEAPQQGTQPVPCAQQPELCK